MGLDTACAVEVALAVALAVLIVAIVAASAGACAGAGAGAAVHDVELALGDATTLMTYEQARAAGDGKAAAAAAEDEAPRCALCLSEYAGAEELVRVVPACGHFFHAECGVDGWLRARGTCPLCRGEVWALPRPPRPEGPPLPAR
ncbi:hypothetical protein U9M48_010020 [Paspalum notatum var. saurae]|uniref:RING-type domain-containing protein n=1 Tax=Paspalum notatum var. saurae TaxID=547442 RepID=A0AAQ3SS77_PASNO